MKPTASPTNRTPSSGRGFRRGGACRGTPPAAPNEARSRTRSFRRARRLSRGLLVFSILACGCGGSDDGSASVGFDEFAWQAGEPDVRTERLCAEAADPDHAADTTFIHCDLEGATFASTPAAPKSEITVVAYNILRGFESARQIEVLRAGDALPVPDVLLLSEVDRGCRRTQFRNVAREYAEAFGYYYVYATEFVELPSDRGEQGPYDPPLCEHGNAIVSRYPLGNVRQIRHPQNRSWYTPPGYPDPDEPRLGGRIAIAADMLVGSRLVRLYAMHLESTTEVSYIRDAQAVEIAEEGETVDQPVIAGGDLNAYGVIFDLRFGSRSDNPSQAFLTRGYTDAHAALAVDDRPTNFDPVPLVIDLIYVRGAVAVQAAGVCPRAVCGDFSDHLPIWATVALEDVGG